MEMTIGTMFDLNAGKYPDLETVIFEDARATYSELYDRVNQRANALLGLGVERGEHIAVLASNCMELVESVLAIWRIGAVCVPLNFRLSTDELTYVVNYSDATTILFLDVFEEAVRKIKPAVQKLERFLFIGEKTPGDFIDFETVSGNQSTAAPNIGVKEEDTATILFTAGTTGKPKGVVANHRRWVWASMAVVLSRLSTLNPETKSLLSGPYFHAGGIGNFLFCLLNGSPQVILKKFDPRDVLEWIEREKINRMQGVATLYNMILQVSDIERYDVSSIHTIGSGAETMPDETRKRLKRVFPGAGLVEGYGMTESCGILSVRSAEFTGNKPYSVGLPPPIIEIRVVDEAGRPVPPDTVGEIIARGPNIMVEYYKDPEKTADALRDGWLYTHDLGRFDEDGFLYVIERKNDMIKSGGENIYPKEVEDVLFRHPKIAEAAVFGIRDRTWGENVTAAIVLEKDEVMTEEEVIAFCKDNLASFKKPKVVNFVDFLPRSTVGKVLRSELRKRFGEVSKDV